MNPGASLPVPAKAWLSGAAAILTGLLRREDGRVDICGGGIGEVAVELAVLVKPVGEVNPEAAELAREVLDLVVGGQGPSREAPSQARDRGSNPGGMMKP
ncbi:hypothetical protein ACWIG5_21320 [Streptomyces lydicus]